MGSQYEIRRMLEEMVETCRAAACKDGWALFWHMGSVVYFAKALGIGAGADEIARFLCWSTGSTPAVDPWEEALQDPEIKAMHDLHMRAIGQEA